MGNYEVYRRRPGGGDNFYPMRDGDRGSLGYDEAPVLTFKTPGLAAAAELALTVEPLQGDRETLLVRCIDGGIGVFTISTETHVHFERAVIT